jgi:hypothetical protein
MVHFTSLLVHEAVAEYAASSPADTDTLERLEELEEEVVVLAAHLHAGEHRFLTLVGEFDRLKGWELAGHRSCAHWLAFRTGIDLGACREKVRAARVLEGLPLTSESMQRGELSFSQVRALTRVATAGNEADLLDLARGATTAQLERMVRAWKLGSKEAEVDRERLRYESRELSVFPDDDGMVLVRGRLTPEAGALLMRAVEAAGDALFRAKGPVSGVSAETSQRRADALALVAERALAAGFGTNDPESEARAPLSGTRAERYQVLLHVDHETLSEEGSGLGRSDLENGIRVSAETSRRLSCDASTVEIRHDEKGAILDVGRKTRTIPPSLRRALEARDGGCRFPGCGLRFTDAHHVKHWADGGETKLENLLLLCAHHHRLLHEDGWKIEWWGRGAERRPAFLDPRGQVHMNRRSPMPRLGPDAANKLVQETRARGADPDFRTAGARWKRESDIPADVYFRALEALG